MAAPVRTRIQSVLAADFGSVNTRVILIDLVNGQYRLVSRFQTPTTLREVSDVMIGMSRAVEILQNRTGRTLLDREGILILPEQDDGSGVDELIVTTSATRPLKAVLVGLIRDISMSSAERALSGTYIDVAATISYSDDLTEEGQINTILRESPDLIFVTGGTNGGNINAMQELIAMVKLAIQLFPEGEQPIVLYAGNQDLAAYAYSETHFDDLNNDVFAAPNIRPAINDEDLKTARLELSLVYNEFVATQPGGFRELASYYAKAGVIPTAQGVSNIIRWLTETYEAVLHLDIGSATSALTVGLNKEVSANVQSDLGIGHNIVRALDQINLTAVQDWLPFPYSIDQIYTYAYDKTLIPGTIPQDSTDLMIEYAILRGIIQYLVKSEQETWRSMLKRGQNLPDFNPIIVSGATITDTAHPGITSMLVIDAFELEGVHYIHTDPFSILPALGATALLEPTITVQVFENQALSELGPAFCASGRPRRRGNKPGMKIRIKLKSGRTIAHDLPPGEIWSAPLSPGQEAEVDVRLGRGLSINGKRRIRRTVKAGTAGIIFDARGRPVVSDQVSARPAQFNRWWEGITGQPLEGWERWNQVQPEAAHDYAAEVERVRNFIAKTYSVGSSERDN